MDLPDALFKFGSKKKKFHSKRMFLYFGMEKKLSEKIFKNYQIFLYFLKRKLSLYFGKWKPRKNSLYFKKRNFLIF